MIWDRKGKSVRRAAGHNLARRVALVACGALVLAGCDSSVKAERAEVPVTVASLPPTTGTTQTSASPQPPAPLQGPSTGSQTTPSPTFPPAFTTAGQGDRASAVFLAVARDPLDPKLTRARADLRQAGYPEGTTYGDIDCYRGAREALRLNPDQGVNYTAVAVYFRAPEQARQFVDSFEPGVVGTADVTVSCAD